MKTESRGTRKSRAPKDAKKTAGKSQSRELKPVFLALRELLKRHEGELVPQIDQPTHYCLESKTPTYRNRPMYFAGVRMGKNYVSYHLMPVYACPELAKAMSQRLRKRMQGKACFNFIVVDREMFAELAQLTDAGFEKFKNLKYL